MLNVSVYRFNGKCYDTGSEGKQPCDLCHRTIRYVYTVVEEGNEREKIQIGSCCFTVFEQDNPKLYQALQYAKGYLQSTVDAKESAIRLYGRRDDVHSRMEQWRQIKRQALSQVRKYRKETGKPWLPESLFELEQIALQKPPVYKKSGNALRWFEGQTRKMQEQIAKTEVRNEKVSS